MGWFLFGVALLAAAVFLARWYTTTTPETLWRAIRWIGIGIAGALVLFFLFRGGFHFLWVLAVFLLPWLLRARAIRNVAKSARGPSGGQRSTVRTRFVDMELDHDTGEMDGIVKRGAQKRRRLSDMALDDLIDLLREAAAEDAQSAQVVQAYLDRMHGSDWREAAGAAGVDGGEHQGSGGNRDRGAASTGRMSRAEAFDVLGLSADAGEDDIKAAHRKLIREYHPDHGGSDYLAAKINEAKDVLLGD